MQNLRNQAGYIRGKAAIVLSVVLLAQAALVYGYTRTETISPHTPLADLTERFGPWQQIAEHSMEPEVQAVLRADDTVNRSYVNTENGRQLNLFVAYFNTQRKGVTPHSPKNCLPGAGWTPTISETIHIDNVPGRAEPLEANRYIVQRGEAKSLVLYWYQSRDRTVASEYTAKFFVVADAVRYNRTDTAMVRVVLPLIAGDDTGEQSAIDFVRAVYPSLRAHFPA